MTALNFFSIMFTKNPLIIAVGPPKEGLDERFLLHCGRILAIRSSCLPKKPGDGCALVPSTWQLVRRDILGIETILAKNVLSYDLYTDGSVIYTNGAKVFHLIENNSTVEIGHGKLIERVAALK